MNPVAAFLAWRNRRRAARIIAQAEHKPLLHPLRQATEASLHAYVEGRG